MKRYLGRAVIAWCAFKFLVTVFVLGGAYCAVDGKLPAPVLKLEKFLGSRTLSAWIHRNDPDFEAIARDENVECQETAQS